MSTVQYERLPHSQGQHGQLVCAAAALFAGALLLATVPSPSPSEGTARFPQPDRSLSLLEYTLPDCDLPRFLPVWNYEGLNRLSVQLKVLTYNLFWWNLFNARKEGHLASELIEKFGRERPYDLMGFQEVENCSMVLDLAGLLDDYNMHEVLEGGTKAICIAYRRDVFELISFGHGDVAEDHKAQYYGLRSAQWVRLRHLHTNMTVFFMNHHGPLPVDTGGRCGGVITAYKLLDTIHRNALKGDAVVAVGDFNAGRHAVTIRTLERHLFRILTGNVDGGVDNIFSNVGNSSVIGVQNMGNGGSDHDALTAVLKLSAGVVMPKTVHRPEQCHLETGVSYRVKGDVVLKSLSGQFLTVERDSRLWVQPDNHERLEDLDATTAAGRRLELLSAFDVYGYHGSFVAEDAGKAPLDSSRKPLKQIGNDDGTVSFRMESGGYLAMERNGTASIRHHVSDAASIRFSVFTTAWVVPFRFVQSPELCCGMCLMGLECQAWSWSGGMCMLRGGGVLERVRARHGIVSGVRSGGDMTVKKRRELAQPVAQRRGLMQLDAMGSVVQEPMQSAAEAFEKPRQLLQPLFKDWAKNLARKSGDAPGYFFTGSEAGGIAAEEERQTTSCCAMNSESTCTEDSKISGYCNLSPARCESVCLGTWLQPNQNMVVDNVMKQMLSREASISVWTPPVIAGVHPKPMVDLPTTLPMRMTPTAMPRTTMAPITAAPATPPPTQPPSTVFSTSREEDSTTPIVLVHTLPPGLTLEPLPTEAPVRENTLVEAPSGTESEKDELPTTTSQTLDDELLEGDDLDFEDDGVADNDEDGCCSYEPFIGCGETLHISGYCDTREKCRNECIGHWMHKPGEAGTTTTTTVKWVRDPAAPCCSFGPFKGCGDELNIAEFCDVSKNECEKECLGEWLEGGPSDNVGGLTI